MHFGSRIQGQKDFGFRIRIKEYQYFKPKKLFPSTRIYDPRCSSRIRILILLLPDPGVKKAPDPGSGTLKSCRQHESENLPSGRDSVGLVLELLWPQLVEWLYNIITIPLAYYIITIIIIGKLHHYHLHHH